jgi:hypothetical protein
VVGAGSAADALGGGFTPFEVARAEQHGQAASGELFGDLESDAFVCPGDQGDAVFMHALVLGDDGAAILAILGGFFLPRLPKPGR